MTILNLSSRLVPIGEGGSYYHKVLRVEGSPNSTHIVFLHDSLKYHKNYQKFGMQLSRELNHIEELHFIDFPGHGLSPGTRFSIENQKTLSLVLLDLLTKLQNKKVLWFAEGMGASALLLLSLQKPRSVNPEDKLILLNPFLYPTHILPNYLEQRVSPPLTDLRLPKKYYKAGLEDYKNDFLVGQNLTFKLWTILWEMHVGLKDFSYFLPNQFYLLLNKNAQHIEVDKVKKYFENHPSPKNKIQIDEMDKILLQDESIEKVCKDLKKWLD